MAKRKRSTFERLQRGERLSRRERKQIERQFQAEEPGWEIVHRNVAGIDVGNESHFVSGHLSIMLCLSRSYIGLEARLKHGVELMQYSGGSTAWASPAAFLEGRDG